MTPEEFTNALYAANREQARDRFAANCPLTFIHFVPYTHEKEIAARWAYADAMLVQREQGRIK